MENTAKHVGSVVASLVAVVLGLVIIVQVRSLKDDIDAAEGSLSDLNESLQAGNTAEAGPPVLVTNLQVVVTNTIVTNLQVVVTNVISSTERPVAQIGTNVANATLVSAFRSQSNEWAEVVKLAEFEAEEARFALKQLSGRNRKNLEEKLALEKKIASLSASLSLLQAEKALAAAEKDAAEVGESIDIASDSELSLFDGRVTDYNEMLKMVIINLGTDSGVKARMKFSLMKQGKAIAVIRVVDPRRKLSGAEIEELEDGQKPSIGDRIIPYRSDESNGS